MLSQFQEQVTTDPSRSCMFDYVDADLPIKETTLLLEQNLDDIDLVAVIKAINNL